MGETSGEEAAPAAAAATRVGGAPSPPAPSPPAPSPPAPRPLGPAEVARHLVAGLGTGAGDAVFGALNDLVLVLGPDATVAYANPTASTVLGMARERIVGLAIVDLVHPDDLDRAVEAEAQVGTPSASVGVAAPVRLRHGSVGWRWLDLSSGRMGPADDRRTIVVGRLNDDQRTYEEIVAKIAEGASVAAVADALPGLAAWRLPDIPFAVACATRSGRHVTGHPAATDLLRWNLTDRAWLDGLGDDGRPHHGPVSDLGPAAVRWAGVRAGPVTWVAARVWSADRASDAIVMATTTPDTSPASVVAERVRRVAGMARLVVEWAAQRDVLDQVGRTDPLTGVLTRGALLDAVAAALDRGPAGADPVAVVVVDLDGFAAVNTQVGQRAGDGVLVEVVRRIVAAVGPDAVVGRWGGDTFGVVLRGPGARVGAEAAARRAIEAVGAPVVLGRGAPVTCGLSAGIAVSDGREHPPSTADDLVARAELALTLARTAGGNRSVTTTV